MATCQKPGCTKPAVAGLKFCDTHQAVVHPLNVVTPAVPMVVKVKAQLQADKAEGVAKAQPLARQAVSLAASPLGAAPVGAFPVVQPPRPVAPPKPLGGAAAPRLINPAADPYKAKQQQQQQLKAKLKMKGSGKPGDPEKLKPVTDACLAIVATPKFAQYIDDEVGWTNTGAWVNWAFRAAAPGMAQRPVTEEIMEALTRWSLQAEMNDGRKFAARFFFELSLYCMAQIEKMDIEFVFSQASMLFTPLLAPLLAIPAQLASNASGAVAGYATNTAVKIGKAAVEAGAKAGIHQAKDKLLTAPSDRVGVTNLTGPQVKKYRDLNPMRFALALWKFCATEKEPAGPINLVLKEFGGKANVIQLWDIMELNNL